ncbi:HNH endonuclease [Massilia sp. W12]|uniref:HNH endonuclease n=1 Tax=Massilia sp. W12 TaxID=3126507 RepID=UPI0030D01136
MKLTNIASLDPDIINTGRKGLPGASNADRAMWQEMQADWQAFALHTEAARKLFEPAQSEHTKSEEAALVDDFSAEDRTVLSTVRVGQSFFRNIVLSTYDQRCCISGLSVPQFLIASHIVPWSWDVKNRINPHNGLCLSVLHDKAFDSGLLCIQDDLTVCISPKLKAFDDPFLQQALLQCEGARLRLPDKFLPDPAFLRRHREEIFQHG